MNTTTTELPPLVTAYVQAMNGRQADAFAALFTPRALVHDEGHVYCGRSAIEGWIAAAWRQYEPTLEVSRVAETKCGAVVTGLVTGTFPGSPVELHHHLTTIDGKIAALAITV